MRLLVYGGNQHGERRRIGVWSDAVGPRVFQDTYGSSMMSVSFGVGILDDAPFLILRKIENFGERAYPLEVLFDPGREIWTRFDWNGAHLLWALFGKTDYPGLKLLTDPESYHTDEDLEKLLAEVDENILPQSDGEPIADPEHLLDLWSGAVFARDPLIAQVDTQLTGFSSRPDLKGLSDLLNMLPSSLRCGKGWLFGGRDRHAESLGAHLVFDDGKADAPSDSDREFVVQYRRQGHDLRAALETFAQSTDDVSLGLKELLSKPIFEWTGAEALPQLLNDILLLKELNDRGRNEVVIVNDDLDKLFARVNERLKQDGQLNDKITSAAKYFLERHQHSRTKEETTFILTQAAGEPEPKIKDEELGNLNGDAAYSFFVAKKIYPAEAVDWMPPTSRVDVCKKLLEVEEQTEKIPRIFQKEAEMSPGYESQNLDTLLETAVKRSAETVHGLQSWSALFVHPTIGANVQRVVRNRVFHQVAVDKPDSIADYLILGDDAGAKKLTTIKPALKETQPLEALLQFITDKIDDQREPALAEAAREWLSNLAGSELRLELSLRTKDYIADRLNYGWENYIFLRRAYLGGSHLPVLSRVADEQERKFLAQELALRAEETEPSQTNFMPALDHLAALLAPDQLGTVVEVLVDLHPILKSGAGDMNWVEAWARLAEHKAELDEDQWSKCQAKHRSELVRLILETDTPVNGRAQLEALGPDDLTFLFKKLLTAGEVERDGFRRKRLLEVLKHLGESKGISRPLQAVVEEVLSNTSEREQLGRRLLGHKDAISAVHRRLTKEQGERFNSLFEQRSSEAIESTKGRLHTILLSAEPGDAAFSSLGEVNVSARKFGDDVFREALAKALEELMTDQEKIKAFFAGGANSISCFQFFKETLTRQSDKKLLTELDKQTKIHKRIAEIEQAILQGGPDLDKASKERLLTIFKDPPNEVTRETLNRVVKQALSTEQSFLTLSRRFVYVRPQGMLGYEPREVVSDKVLEHLFGCSLPETRREFLRQLWKLYAEHGDKSPMVNSARNALRKLENNKVKTKQQGSRRRGAEKDFYLEHFETGLINFLAHNSTLRKQVIELEFTPDQFDFIENLISEFVPDAQEEVEIKVVVPAPTKSRLDPRGWFGKRSGSKS